MALSRALPCFFMGDRWHCLELFHAFLTCATRDAILLFFALLNGVIFTFQKAISLSP